MGTWAAPGPGCLRRLTTAEAIVEGIATETDSDPSVVDLADQFDNHLAKFHDESGGVTVPMVLTTAVGSGYSDAARYSRCPWGSVAHLSGTKVVAPSNPYDAKGLMISAIRDDSPVVCIFHKGVLGLSWMPPNPYATAEVPAAAYEVPIGRAAVARSGTDITVVTVSLSVHHTLEVAETLSGQGIDVEVIDLRSLVPLDRDAIADSVARTGRLVVVDEDYVSYGMSGEVAATVTDAYPSPLRAPVHRVPDPDNPVHPGPGRIEAAIRQVLAT